MRSACRAILGLWLSEWDALRFAAVILLPVLVLLLLPSTAPAASYERGTLKGLKELSVLIEELKPEVGRAGLSKDQLKTDVELRLRKAHIRVVGLSPPGYLYVNVQALRQSGGWVYSVHVGLNQDVTLDRDKSISCSGETWSEGTLGTATRDKFVAEVRDALGDQVDRFINDYLAANP